MDKIIGRKYELQQLQEAYTAKESLFVVVYGRRRVGKTFLVRKAFQDNMAFYATGVNKESKEVPLNKSLRNTDNMGLQYTFIVRVNPAF